METKSQYINPTDTGFAIHDNINLAIMQLMELYLRVEALVPVMMVELGTVYIAV